MKLTFSFARVLVFSLGLVPAAALAAEAPKKVLVVTVTTGFRHSSIPVAEKIPEQLAKESGKFTVEFVRQPDGQPKAPQQPRPGKAGADDPAHQAALKNMPRTRRCTRPRWRCGCRRSPRRCRSSVRRISKTTMRCSSRARRAMTCRCRTSRASWTGWLRARVSSACTRRRTR